MYCEPQSVTGHAFPSLMHPVCYLNTPAVTHSVCCICLSTCHICCFLKTTSSSLFLKGSSGSVKLELVDRRFTEWSHTQMRTHMLSIHRPTGPDLLCYSYILLQMQKSQRKHTHTHTWHCVSYTWFSMLTSVIMSWPFSLVLKIKCYECYVTYINIKHVYSSVSHQNEILKRKHQFQFQTCHWANSLQF